MSGRLVPHYGTVALGETIVIPFQTTDPSTGWPVDFTGGFVVLFRDDIPAAGSGGVSGIVLRKNIDTRTGLHTIAIDPSISGEEDAPLTFNSEYTVVLDAFEIGAGPTIAMPVGIFSYKSHFSGAVPEPTAPINFLAANPTQEQILGWLAALMSNEFIQADATGTVRNSADTGDLATYPTTFDGSLFTSGKPT